MVAYRITNPSLRELAATPHPWHYWYLATPYSKWKDGYDDAARHAAAIAAELMTNGVKVFSPIPHSHHVFRAGDLPATHDFWMAQDEPLMAAAYGLLVAKMDGWDQSRGVAHEIGFFSGMQKPIHYLDLEQTGAVSNVIPFKEAA